MRNIKATKSGGPEVLELCEREAPSPGPGQLLVKVAAAGVNFIDIYQRTGLYKVDLPFVPGLEGAGEVLSSGPGVSGFAEGARVAWAMVPGSYATHALVPADKAVPVPAAVPLEVAAALMLQGMTAHYLVTSTHALKAGEAALVHAAAGGVGLLLCQLARAKGAVVIGTVSTDEKARLAREAGATHVAVHGRDDFVAMCREATGGAGVHVAYDSIGRDTFEQSMASLRPRGMLVLYGNASGPVPAFDPLLLSQRGSLFVTRPSLGHYVATREELLWRASELFDEVVAGRLSVRIGARLSLAEAGEAHRRLSARETTGKVLLVP